MGAKILYGIMFALGLVLFLDQIPVFGVDIRGFLPDLSFLDPTQPYTDIFNHWMLGLFLMITSTLLIFKRSDDED